MTDAEAAAIIEQAISAWADQDEHIWFEGIDPGPDPSPDREAANCNVAQLAVLIAARLSRKEHR